MTHSYGSIIPAHRVIAAGNAAEALWRSVALPTRPYGGCYDNLYLDIYPESMEYEDLLHVPRRQRLRPGAVTRVDGDELPAPVATALDQDHPILYVTFGTAFQATPAFAAAVAAAARLDGVAVVVTVGPTGDLAAFGPQPGHVHIARYIPQSDVIPRCSAVVSHAGSGTMLEALAHGIAQVCLPQAADQFRNAKACSAVGAGIALVAGEVTIDTVETALRRVLTDRELARGAERVAAEIAAMPSAEAVCPVLETLRR